MYQAGDWAAVIQESLGTANIDIYLIQKRTDNKISFIGQDGSIKTVDEGVRIESALRVGYLHRDVLQALCDALQGHGYRPKERRYEKEIETMRHHLQDMRALVFKGRVKPSEEVETC